VEKKDLEFKGNITKPVD